MKSMTLILGVISITLMILVTIDAAVIDKVIIKHNRHVKNRPGQETHWRKEKKKINPHALSASDERFGSCGSTKDVFQLSSVSSNRHLCSGCKACIDLEGRLKGTIDQGSNVRLQASKFFFTVYDETFDLCALLDKAENGPRCPIAPNQDGLRACLPLDKSLTTDISADLVVTATDSAMRPLFCIEGSAMVESTCPSDVGPGSQTCNG
ncbi:hypothetical protein BGZ83_012043 [Gryganskiella cystojenkinii]|nr:hypothetical protein BGZ83_012043 [Gryganskiella cystojenkinii]